MNGTTTDNNRQNITASELILYYKSELNAEEQERVEAWIVASAENKAIAEEVYTVVWAKDILETVQSTSVAEDLKIVHRKIQKRQVNFYLKKLQQVAAILFIPLLMLTVGLLVKEQMEIPEAISYKTNPGIIADFSLPDGTKVWLNAQSTLSFPSSFKGNRREVTLSGEAYFSVKEDKAHPFIVKTIKDIEVEVTGTEFNIDAYEKSGMVSTMLVSGGVKMHYTHPNAGKRTTLLKPGQKIVFTNGTKDIKLMSASTLVETGWKDGKIYLKNTPLEHLLHTLNKRFNIDFILTNEKLKENSFTGTFASQDLDMILKHLEVSSGIKHKIIKTTNDENEEIKTVELY